MSDFEIRLKQLEEEVLVNKVLAEGLQAAHDQIFQWFAALGGVAALETLHERILADYDSLRQREEDYVKRMDEYFADMHKRVASELRLTIQSTLADEVAFRKSLINEIANRFPRVIPVRQATRAEIAAGDVVLTRPATREEIKAN